VQFFFGKSELGLAADGIVGQVFLEFVIGIVGYIGDTAPVDDGSFFFLSRNRLNSELLLVATISVSIGHLNRRFQSSGSDHAQVNLYQVFFIFKNLIAEMNTAAATRANAPRLRSNR